MCTRVKKKRERSGKERIDLFKKKVQRDGCLLSNVWFALGYTNLSRERQRSFIASAQLADCAPESGTRREDTLEILGRDSLAISNAWFQIVMRNRNRRVASERFEKNVRSRHFAIFTLASLRWVARMGASRSYANSRNVPRERWKYLSIPIQARLSTCVN